MRIVREYINEKFTQDSDPIRDLKIGLIDKPIDFKNKMEFYEFIYENILGILKLEELPEGFVSASRKYEYILEDYFEKLMEYFDKYFTFNNRQFRYSDERSYWPGVLRWCLLNKKLPKDENHIERIVKEIYVHS